MSDLINTTDEIYSVLTEALNSSYPQNLDRFVRVLSSLFQQMRDNVIDVRDFGAVPDGVTDNLQAFLAARNSVPANQAATIRVPYVEGTVNRYYLSTSMTGQSGNFIRWVFDDNVILINSPGSATAAFGRISGNDYWKEYRTSLTPRLDVKADRDTTQGGAIASYETIENPGPDPAYGYRVAYVSSGYGQDTFDIGEGVLCRWERTPGDNRAGQQLTSWRVAMTPQVPNGDNNRYGTFIAEYNIGNRGPDVTFVKRRADANQFCGFLQIVPEQQLLNAPTAIYGFGNVTYGIVTTWAHGDDGGRGFVPRIMCHYLAEPNSVHDSGWFAYASGSDGTDTLPGGGPSQGALGLDEQWKWGIKTNEATFTREAVALGRGHKIGWLDSSDVLTGAIEQDTTNAWGMGISYSTRGVPCLALAFGRSSANGDRQNRTFHLRRNLSSPTNVKVTTDGGPATALNQLVLANSSAVRISGRAVARSGAGDAAGWSIQILAKRGANAASTTIVSQTITKDTSDAGASTWTLAAVADTTNGAVSIEATGTGSFNVMVHLDSVETVG